MSAHDLDRLSPEEKRASEAVRSLAPPPADAGYRARLKQEFASGALVAAAPSEGVRPLPVPFYRRPALRWAALPVAAAAALVAVSTLNQGPRWELISSRGEGVAVIDAVPVPMNHADELARRLKPGVRLRLPEGAELEIASRGQIAMQITPGTDVTLPEPPGRWFGRHARAGIAEGDLRITTGSGFRGARLEVETPEAIVEVTGTTLAVICEPGGTCVCVLEGRVTVAGRGEGTKVAVSEGRRRFVFNDARPPEVAGIRPAEDVMLRQFRAERRAVMEGATK
jgi:ferric-dicitrate binding protein FerR (iron transport regulator)